MNPTKPNPGLYHIPFRTDRFNGMPLPFPAGSPVGDSA